MLGEEVRQEVLAKSLEELEEEAKNIYGKTLVTKQTGPAGKQVKRLYIEEVSQVKSEFYLSCLIDRASSKIAFISSTEGGMDIEQVAEKNPEKIVKTKFNFQSKVLDKDFQNIIKDFKLNNEQQIQARKIIDAIYKILIEKVLDKNEHIQTRIEII